ncbi:hypothetical protein A2U01_0033774 [Trifolium medium]|uniref:Uncharacterized protein n=1 Tax=Trifolium medium TaxID=97028 RepID=A0A392PKS1_9FABA|nr:hypothetical protein [Trifolium medium]
MVPFEREILKTENAAEDHIRQFMPKLAETDVDNGSPKSVYREHAPFSVAEIA